MKKILMITLVVMLIALASGVNWIWKSYDDTGDYEFELSGNSPVSIINPAGNAPSTLEVQAGDQFSLTMDANPTTGFQWDLAEDLDGSVLRLVSKDYTASPSQPGIVGVGGKETWTFQAVGQGTADITLIYRQPWDTESPPAVTKQFNIVITNAGPGPVTPVTPLPSADIVTVVGATLTFSISQPVVPGGEWNITGLDESILTLINDETVTQEGIVGAALRVLTFRAVGPGLTTVQLENQSNRASFTALIVGQPQS